MRVSIKIKFGTTSESGVFSPKFLTKKGRGEEDGMVPVVGGKPPTPPNLTEPSIRLFPSPSHPPPLPPFKSETWERKQRFLK